MRLADVIETLDRPQLADAIAAAIAKEGRTPTLLIEVNVGDEPQKAGVGRAEADAFIDECKGRFGAALAGLMCVPPLDRGPAAAFHLAGRSRREAWAAGTVDGHVGGFRGGDRLRRHLGAGRQRDLRGEVENQGAVRLRCGWGQITCRHR